MSAHTGECGRQQGGHTRVSREVRNIVAVVARMEKAAEKGYVVASGFVSKGEQAVRDMLCGKGGARLIHVRPSCISNARFRPETQRGYIAPSAESWYNPIVANSGHPSAM